MSGDKMTQKTLREVAKKVADEYAEEKFIWEDDFDALFPSEQYTYDDDTREDYLFNDDVDAREVKQWIEDKIRKVSLDIIERCLNEIPDELPMVDETWTYSDTDYQSNAVRYGINECRETAIKNISGLKKEV